MAQIAPKTLVPVPWPPRSGVPPLFNGDHLTRAEFERRFNATPGLKRAELIEGVAYVSPLISIVSHGSPHFDLIGLLSIYRFATFGIIGADCGSIRMDSNNMPQPDIFLLINPALGGQARIDADDYLAGAPEFIVEVAATSASYDLHEKLQVYCRSGVREYIVWRTLDGELDYFILRNGEYHRHVSAADGIYRSEALPGLWLDAAALLAGDSTKVARQIHNGLASPEHAAFVAGPKLKAAQ